MKQISADLKNPLVLLEPPFEADDWRLVTEAATVEGTNIAATTATAVNTAKNPALPDVLARASNTTSNNSFQMAPRRDGRKRFFFFVGKLLSN